jgi:excinuclease UvrABC ATPase subunit
MNNDTYDDRFSRIKKDLYILEGKFNELEHDFTSLKSLLNTAIGSCNACAGTGMLYDVDEDAGRDLTRPCDHCKGTGKMPLDIVSMMAQFKLQARKEIQNETDIPF